MIVNGVLLGSGSVSATSFSREASDLYLGVNFWPDGLFNGSIDEVKVYDTAVSAAEAKALYNGGIAVSGDSSNKVVGDTVELDAVVTDGTEGATIAWTSSNEEIATVADGIVTCVGEGKVGIKASLMNGETEIASDTFRIVVDLEILSVYVNDIANFTFDDEATGFSGAGAKAVAGNGTLAHTPVI
ncbi:MAG: LamG-like jellyroll fold domain-containing protein [Lachnoclostridium sp.]